MSVTEVKRDTVVFTFWRPGMENMVQLEEVDLKTREVIARTLKERRGITKLGEQDRLERISVAAG